MKDLKMIKHQIIVNFNLEKGKKLNQMNKSVQEMSDDIKTWKQILNISEIGLLKHLKMKKLQIKADLFLEISQIWEQVSESYKEVNNCIKNLEGVLSISEIDLLKVLYHVKNLKFVNFEENKHFYRVLKEKDGVYKGLVGVGQEDSLIKEGKGNKEYKDGRFFEGEWKNSKREGKGILRYANGAVYEGEFKDDKTEGKGILKYKNGNVYEGEFKYGSAEGKGIEKYSNGDVYEGEFKNGLKEGKGIFKYKNGNVYEGEFKDDKREGKGILKYANGNVYEGRFKDDKLERNRFINFLKLLF